MCRCWVCDWPTLSRLPCTFRVIFCLAFVASVCAASLDSSAIQSVSVVLFHVHIFGTNTASGALMSILQFASFLLFNNRHINGSTTKKLNDERTEITIHENSLWAKCFSQIAFSFQALPLSWSVPIRAVRASSDISMHSFWHLMDLDPSDVHDLSA